MVTQNMLRTWRTGLLWRKIVTSVDRSKCLKQMKLPISLYNCAPTSELTSSISTMAAAMLGSYLFVDQIRRVKNTATIWLNNWCYWRHNELGDDINFVSWKQGWGSRGTLSGSGSELREKIVPNLLKKRVGMLHNFYQRIFTFYIRLSI